MAESRPSRRAVSVALFVVLGLVGAFLVSMVAGLGEGDGAASSATRVGAGMAARAPGVEDRADVRVEVLNGAGRNGLAREATQRLRGDGFDVVFFGNASSFDRPRSVVLDRTGRTERAAAVAASLGIDSIASAPDPGLLLDVSVVLGADWPPRTPARRGLLERVRDALGGDHAVP